MLSVDHLSNKGTMFLGAVRVYPAALLRREGELVTLAPLL